MALQIFKKAKVEIRAIHTTKVGYNLDINKARILRQNIELDSVHLVIGYEAKCNDFFLDQLAVYKDPL